MYSKLHYVLKSGKRCICRFATSKYKEPTGYNLSNMFMHLTNYSVNKHSRMYVIDDEIGSKRCVYIGTNRIKRTIKQSTDNRLSFTEEYRR